jgi:UDPglucose 6-dehydrogenase
MKVAKCFSDPKNTEIAIFGYAFKKNTSDTRATPVASIINYLLEQEFVVKIHDPEVSERSFQIEMEMQGFNIAEKTNIQFCGKDYDKAV